MNLNISTRLLLGFGLLVALMALMVGLGVYSVTSIGARLDTIVHGHYKDTMNTVDIRETVNEVARAVYNLATTADMDARRRDVARLEDSHVIINKNLESLKPRLIDGEGAAALKKALDTYTRYDAAKRKVMALAVQNQDKEMDQAIQQELRPAQNALFNALDGIVNYQSERMESSSQEAKRLAEFARALLFGFGLLAMIVGALFSVWISRSIAGPTEAASQLSQAISDGDLTHPVIATSKDELGLLLAALEKMRLSLTRDARTIRQSAENVALTSREIAQGSSDLSNRAEQQAARLEETAASMEELTATVKQNTASAALANNLAASASEVASRGGAEVRGVVGTMQGIAEASRRIADIIGVIDSIAFQTNILALNAAVEAARAGEQGRGFAVVATEVRGLAQRSAQAAKEISRLIQDSTVQVDAGAKLVENAGYTMDEIVAAVKNVTEIIADIAIASHEQLTGIEQVNQAVSEMSGVTQQNAAVVEQSAAAAENLSNQAQELITAVARFKLDEGERNQRQGKQSEQREQRESFRPRAAAASADAPLAAWSHTPTAKRPPPAPALPSSGTNTHGDGNWKEF